MVEWRLGFVLAIIFNIQVYAPPAGCVATSDIATDCCYDNIAGYLGFLSVISQPWLGNPQLEGVFIDGNCLFVTLEDPLSVALWMKVAMVVRRSPNIKGLALYERSDIPKFSLWFRIFAALVLDDQCCLKVLTCVDIL